jgi:hypothetical protein
MAYTASVGLELGATADPQSSPMGIYNEERIFMLITVNETAAIQDSDAW